MSKSTEKVNKKYADTYKWTTDQVELLLTVTKEYKTRQIAKSIDWESCVDNMARFSKLTELIIPRQKMLLLLADFQHEKDELRKSVLTSKLKAI